MVLLIVKYAYNRHQQKHKNKSNERKRHSIEGSWT